ncbi:hypothetical protein [Pseudoalteromonas sp. MSK9-3]|uniref:hypothetical protein n=1 Tax=Pseudoalteromonas sp. MSK9-3 TaxID=1897633 RepID=UPI0015FFDC4F|nr:hypothetical protein [Pseudoalteromonas sp. MSK9-3]
MKFNLNKKKLKNLSNDHKALPSGMTPNIAGGKNEILSPKMPELPPFTTNSLCCI